jgi:hypothetical protein
MNILKNQNVRYSKICRKLYNNNQFLKLEVDKLNLVLTLQNEKIAELEKGKLKEKRGKR